MALYPTHDAMTAKGGYGKTHTKLELSNGQAPAEKFVIGRDNTFEPFIYEYGPEGNQSVLLPKGKIVEAGPAEFNPVTGRKETSIREATEGTTKALGVNQHNVYENRRDQMQGTSATVLGRSYIEVPLFEATSADTASTTADAMKFGAAYGETDDLQPGDFVVAGKKGNFRKYVQGTDTPEMILGKVWGVSRELPPAGALQYYTGLQGDALKKAMDDMSGYAGAGAEAKPGHPYSNGAWLPEFLKTIGTGEMKGIPFLTDGYFSAKETVELEVKEDNENVEAIRKQDRVTDETPGTFVVEDGDEEAMIVVKLAHQIDPLETGNVKVTADEGDFTKRDVRVDLKENAVVIYMQGGATYTNLKIEADLVVNPIAGIPTEWDHKGSVGAVRILLNQ